MWTIRYDDYFGIHHELKGINTEDMNMIVQSCCILRLPVYIEYETPNEEN